MYYLYSIQKGTSRQAPFGIWGEPGTNGPGNWPITLLESWGEYCLSREAGVAQTLLATLPDTATGVEIYDALAKAEDLLPWAQIRAEIRTQMVESGIEDDFDRQELADFDEMTAKAMDIPFPIA